jgi:hypothetical protein
MENLDTLKLTFIENVLNEVDSTKYLGVILDKHLSWKNHIEYVSKKIRCIVGIFCKIRRYLNINLLKKLYYAMIHCHLQYCIESWGSAYDTVIQPLVRLQNRMIKIFYNVNKLTPVNYVKLYGNLKILYVRKFYYYNFCQFVYTEIQNGSVSGIIFSFQTCTSVINESSKHMTRSKANNNLSFEVHRTNYYKQSIKHCGRKFFNLIPQEIRKSPSVTVFKRNLKEWLYSNNIDMSNLIFCNRH